jgi:Flagellar biosynthesis protein, FliO
MKQEMNETATKPRVPVGGLAGWLLGRLHVSQRPKPQLALLERIALAPRQSLALVEAEGRRFLVATSTEGAPTFYALDEQGLRGRMGGFRHSGLETAARVSW